MAIMNLLNKSESLVMFAKLEGGRNNRYAEAGKATDLGKCSIPRVDNKDDFLEKAIIVTSLDPGEKILGYIYEQKGRIYLTKNGYREAQEGYLLPNANRADEDLNLVVIAAEGPGQDVILGSKVDA